MKILMISLLVTVLACGGGGASSSGDSRFEYTDPAETTPMKDAHGTPAIDVDRVVMESDGKALVVVLHLEDTLANYLKVVDEGGGFASDPAWIYFDTDGDATTGGFAVPGMLQGFEYEARVVSSLANGKPSTIYALDKFEQGETSFDMSDRYSAKGLEALQARQTEWNRSKSQITVKDSTVTIRFPYASIGAASGETIRIRMREHHRGPYTVEQFFPDATLKLK